MDNLCQLAMLFMEVRVGGRISSFITMNHHLPTHLMNYLCQLAMLLVQMCVGGLASHIQLAGGLGHLEQDIFFDLVFINI